LNLYDTKIIICSKCNRLIGEIEYDAEVTLPRCGLCANPIPEVDDKVAYAKIRVNGTRNEIYARVETAFASLKTPDLFSSADLQRSY